MFWFVTILLIAMTCAAVVALAMIAVVALAMIAVVVRVLSQRWNAECQQQSDWKNKHGLHDDSSG